MIIGEMGALKLHVLRNRRDMGIRSTLSKPIAKFVTADIKRWSSKPEETQKQVFLELLERAKHTKFGMDHGFGDIRTRKDFAQAVPVRDYEGLRPYVERILNGGYDILWPGRPAYFAKTSGTTSGAKYIPITRDSLPNHINSARNALLSYVQETGNAQFLDKKMIFLSGSPILDKQGGILTGRLSGMVNHHVPKYLRSNQMPSYETNCIEDWEEKLDRIIDETLPQPMSLISGIPPWVQMYFDKITERTGKQIKDVFPEFSLFVYGGVNFAPYRDKLFASIGKQVDSIETYPASEGFIAYQDSQEEEGLLLLLNSGIFFEFVPAEEHFDENPTRLTIDQVELGKNYSLILNSNAGLWGYAIGDTVKFVSKDPYRIVVTGRVKHFISAFGEHVIGQEVEQAMQSAISQFPETQVREFTVAPMVTPDEGLPHHEWLVDFANRPSDMEAFSRILDNQLRKLNTYYDDLLSGAILSPLRITPLKPQAFQDYMKSIGKLGGQNKVPRLSNDRKIADQLVKWSVMA